MTKDSYRPEIDGLRAIAVIAVIFYHFGVGAFTGGFVGVDVFFVISGFLITGILVNEARSGRLSIVQFYERRIRRIMPALFAVLIVTWLFGLVLLLPDQLVSVSKNLLFTSFFSSNIWLWRQAGYFAASSEMMPLLHTWSLSVEEQFYIFFPIIVALLRNRLAALRWFSALVALISLAACVYGAYTSPSASFYLLPTRAWELMAGSLLALSGGIRSARVQRYASWAGATLVLFSIFFFDRSLPFPGAYAMVPVLGSVLIIAGGSSTPVGRLLASPPLVFVGLISYSLYLWHWPVLVYSKQLAVSTALTTAATCAALVVTVLLSVASWRWVERPFRVKRGSKSLVIAAGAAAVVAGAAIGMAGILGAGFPSRFSEEALTFANARVSPRTRFCSDTQALCPIGQSPASYIIWGDSHAAALLPSFDIVSARTGKGGVLAAFNGCLPLAVANPGPGLKGRDLENCIKRNASVTQLINESADIKTVFVTAWWSQYKFGESDLERLVQSLPNKEIVLLEDVPIPFFDVPWVLALTRASNRPEFISRPRSPAPIEALKAHKLLRVVSLSDPLCSERGCPVQIGGQALFADNNHISEFAASNIVGPYLAGVLKDLWKM